MEHIKTLLATGLLAGALTISAAASFTDTQDHWAEASINKWSESYQLIRGYEDGTFRPDAQITRGAFAGIMDRFLHFQDRSDGGVFSDLSGSYWEDSILRLHAAGVYLGTNGQALAGNNITRQQAVTMIARAFHLETDTENLPFSDADTISSYARLPVSAMQKQGYLEGVVKDGQFHPTDPITRAEVIQICSNMVDMLVQTPDPVTGDVAGNVLINSLDGAQLQDMTIGGNLILAPGAGGTATLTNVIIQGETLNFSGIIPTVRSIQEPETPPAVQKEPENQAPSVQELETADAGTETETAEAPAVQPDEPENNTAGPLVTELQEALSNLPADVNPGAMISNAGDTLLETAKEISDAIKNEEKTGIQPSEIYTPTETTGEKIPYGDSIKPVPVYALAPKSRLTPADFQWKGDRLTYIGSDYDTRFGIDISAYQNRDTGNGGIDWNAVKNDGVEFAMVRVGFRGYTTGSILADKYAHINIDGAMAAGIETGVYFFAQAITVEEAIEEADFVIEQLKGHTINGPVAYDWEMNDSSYRVYGTPPEMATACAVAFCERVKAAGYTPMVYGGKYVSYVKYDQGALAPYLYWYPEYKTAKSPSIAPTFYYEVDYWQFTDSCTIKGISGKVDCSLQFIPR